MVQLTTSHLNLICCVFYMVDYFIMRIKEFTVKRKLTVFLSIVLVHMALYKNTCHIVLEMKSDNFCDSDWQPEINRPPSLRESGQDTPFVCLCDFSQQTELRQRNIPRLLHLKK